MLNNKEIQDMDASRSPPSSEGTDSLTTREGEGGGARPAEPDYLRAFVKESNRIEGILRPPTAREMQAHRAILTEKRPTVADLQGFVWAVARQTLRDQPGMNVRVGNHIPPPGGPSIAGALGYLLDCIDLGDGAHRTHLRYETLHPFLDGNGRSGRVLWLWQMTYQHRDPWALKRGFLHTFYYQTLSAIPARGASPAGPSMGSTLALEASEPNPTRPTS